MTRRFLAVAVGVCLALTALVAQQAPADAGLVTTSDVGRTWAVHPTGQPVLLTTKTFQYVAYYDANRYLTVAKRRLGTSTWSHLRFGAVRTDWGTTNHKIIAMQIDRLGYVHLAANMHHQEMVYYRMSRPNTISSFRRIAWRTSAARQVTYPAFLKNSGGDLFLTFRSGVSGNAAQVIYGYSVRTGRWSPTVPRLFDGRAQEMSAYLGGSSALAPVRGPDGWFHMAWVWRNTANVSTNHTVSYARSRDLRTWYTAGGSRVRLPITPRTRGLAVDRAGVGSGLFNGLTQVGFDGSGHQTVTYTKYDSAGHSQLWTARFSSGRWTIVQDTHWTYRWTLNSVNTVPVDIDFGAVTVVSPGVLAIDYQHVRYGRGRVLLSAATMRPQATATSASLAHSWPEEITTATVSSSLPMTVDFLTDSGTPPPGLDFVLRWEHGPVNNDRPVSTSKPPSATMLQVVRLNPTQQYYTSEDLALHAQVTTSSSAERAPWGAARVVDGALLPGSGWSSDDSPTSNHSEWVTLDLGESRQLSQLTLHPGDVDGYTTPRTMTFEVSDDGVSWTQVGAASQRSPSPGEQWYSLQNVRGRYVRITGTSLWSNPADGGRYRMRFAEIGVYGSTDVAQGRPVTASSSVTRGAWSLDGLLNGVRSQNVGGWSSDASLGVDHTEWLSVDLGQSVPVGRVALYPTNGGHFYPRSFVVELSDDNVSWRTVVSRTAEPIPARYGDYGFEPTMARYVRLTMTSLRHWSGDHRYFRAQLAEFEVRQ